MGEDNLRRLELPWPEGVCCQPSGFLFGDTMCFRAVGRSSLPAVAHIERRLRVVGRVRNGSTGLHGPEIEALELYGTTAQENNEQACQCV